MRVSVQGALLGAIVGGIGRGLVVVLNIGAPTFWLALPSAGIGALVGAVAGSVSRPLLAALIGAFLSGILFEFFTFALASSIEWFDRSAAVKLVSGSLVYACEMALVGAAAGGAGSWFGYRFRRRLPTHHSV